ncbi:MULTISPECIES: type IX secretion system outer membrane channel protein PorV [Apibacter]|uniref:type IX secretion system outer membrane channel protein PorV n=1 Tax=Apibacter TaxID=1778601 RepID=UPI000CFA233F|nr:MULTISPECIES: type IX secretion system outer membrane channel protein PorV [Apibacter]MCX8676649.1 type IX secretion system outer membrane channel protein PorV [Apibacter sp. B3919]MXO24107.1 type IX secretion system outer membrane channel protein PorV [Apibacter sp. B3924]MXO26212.1 type IX secretion system outer membrane channel protein PorV [Apibacter sp. B3813]MXO28163.1 type IX secretion system outer membrane channel protein PorV [Apibacter sp. B3913]MXO30117.1 type IX secretion system
MKKRILILTLLLFSAFKAQNRNYAIVTGAPFLRISPDARSGGLGDQGVATSPDGFSQFWNPSKYVFGTSYSGVGLSYTPYMNKLTSDVFLLNGTFYTFLGEEERSTLAASIYYFNMGEIQLNELLGNNIVEKGISKPNEFALDVSYGLKLADVYSMAVTARYVRSDLFNNVDNSSAQTKAANTFAVDVTGYFQSEKSSSFGNYEGRWRAGWGLFNMGPKLDYSDSKENSSYLPTNLRLGVGYDLYFDDDNKLGLTFEATKLLVPAPEEVKNPDGSITYQVPDKSFISGMFKSFSNKDVGKEITYSIAGEYTFNNAFAFRTGYFYENPDKGGRQYVTLGAGLKYQSFGIDFSYLITTSSVNNALDNTLRFGLTWDFGGDATNAYDNY